LAKSNKSLEENQAQLKANRAELKQIYAAEAEINDALLERGILLEKENALLQKNIASQKRNKKAIDDSAKSIRSNNKFLEDTEDLLGSIADKVGKSNKLYKEGEKYLERQKSGLSSIADLTESIADPKLSKAAENATNAYKKFQQSVARVGDRTGMNGKQQEEANIAIARARAEYDESVASLSKMGENGEMILATLNGLADETEQFAKSVTATTKEWEAMDAVLDSFSGIPAMSELNTLLKTNIKDTLAFKAAVFALGAALGKAAFDYFGAPIKTAMEQYKQSEQNRIDTEGNIGKLQVDAQSIPKQIEQERLEARVNAEGEIQRLQQEAAFAGQKAAIQFSSQMQSGAAAFERAAKTALFGNKIGSVGYGAAQLQLAGISADQIASGMEAASAATGKMPSGRVGADMAIMAERTGASVDNIASINEMFQRMDGVTESTAMNLSEGLRNMADQANIGLGGLMREIADASKDALSYQIKSGPALAKQVAYAQSLGVSFTDIAKAGKSMVMNYKDSIKNEMQLSAMLGKNVDLSEVRAKFASGDTEGAMKSLQAQGLDPAQMDMFAQEQLSQALGGMDLNSLQKVATKSGAQVGGLKAGNAKGGNQDFLSRTQSAESALNSQQASISAQTAILDAKLSEKIADSYMESPEYASLKTKQNQAAQEAEKLAGEMNNAWINSKAFADQMTKTTKLNFVTGLLENVVSGLAMVLGGGLMSKLVGGGGGGMMSMFGKGGGAAAAATPAAAGGVSTAAAGGGGGAMGGAASGFGGVLKGMAEGLKAFASPQVLVGLAAITASLYLLQPVIESLVPVMVKIAEVVGNVLVKALEMAGPIITSIFNGIGNVITSIGTAIGTIIGSISASVAQFATMDATNLLAVAAGVTALSVAVGLFGAGAVIGAIGSFFGGGVFDDLKDISNYANPIMQTAMAVERLANAFGALSSIDTSALTKIPWGDMEDFASEGGKFVLASSGGGSFALSKETTDNIKKMATNTEAMVKLNNTLVKLTKEGFFGGETSTMKLYIDGKDVNSSMKRYKSNTQNQDPKKG
jgi:hypothetical protein